ncbi:multicopper oxidase domain-containing protein [Actinophytocola sp.]|uniref:multicopper oxidase domain-containing protein n=1 Tax=Actinophytocola sp. TaxID=1872138 RepID=UPI003899A3DB
MRADHRARSGRGFLVLTAGAAAGTAATGLAACGSQTTTAPARIGPTSPQVAAAEQRRRGANTATTPVSLTAAEGAYEFTVPDAGTYWFHPHVGTQLNTGLYAPLIVEDPADGADYDTELVVVLDDWLDGFGRSPDDVLADLRANGTPGMNGMPGMP